ncbi:hypothetical protein [Winogradskyella forsetii]|uniref:hypothetical protein n=1 Tax=Winogradskyella forsetii TaxID=2686077 RepID=UPI0015BCBF7C|nr:hypothetical protein [Winogradskyella forsetii]
MKVKFTLIILLIACMGYAQNGINYKAIIKDDTGNVVALSPVSIQFIIYEGAALNNNVYQESHTLTTDINGMIIVNIGEGATGDDFEAIIWLNDEHFLNVQVNIGSGLVDMGTSMFKTVPYALVAKDIENTIWNTNGTNAFYNEGSIGIGTNNPSEKLHIDGNAVIEGTLRLDSGTSVNSISTATSLGNSDNTLPTQNAVKTYVDTAIGDALSEKSIVIPSAAFVGRSDANPVQYGGGVVGYNAGFEQLRAPFTLPVGATVTNITYYARDTDGTNNLNFRIIGATLTGLNASGGTSTISTDGSQTSIFELSDDINLTINANNLYYVFVTVSGSWTSNMKVIGLKVTYTE